MSFQEGLAASGSTPPLVRAASPSAPRNPASQKVEVASELLDLLNIDSGSNRGSDNNGWAVFESEDLLPTIQMPCHSELLHFLLLFSLVSVPVLNSFLCKFGILHVHAKDNLAVLHWI